MNLGGSNGIGTARCPSCFREVSIVYVRTTPTAPLCEVCSRAMLAKQIADKEKRELERVARQRTDLNENEIYFVKVDASVEYRAEGNFSRVELQFRSRFVEWAGPDERGREYAVFTNGVRVGPKSELGVSWVAYDG